MAFPDNVTTFMQAKDPTTGTDIQNLKAYQNILSSGTDDAFSRAQEYLANMANGIQMNINAGRYNEVIQVIEQIENFYLGLQGVKAYIQDKIDAYSNIGVYDATIPYKVGNVVSFNGSYYICIQANTGTSPVAGQNTEYWNIFVQNQQQYPVQETTPTNLNLGDIWFQVIS